MPIGGIRETKTVGSSYRKHPLYSYAKAYSEAANAILTTEGCDVFDEPRKAYNRSASSAALKKFFVENCYDVEDKNLTPDDIEDKIACMEAQFENDVQAMNEHAVLPEYNPIVGMSLPIHKLILMNNVFDKGAIQKVTAVQPKFTISMERQILVTPTGEELDMFLDQNKMTDAINSTAPLTEIEMTLPEYEGTDVIGALGGTSLDNLVLSTTISAVKVKDVVIEKGDILPNADGYIVPGGEVATSDTATTTDVWFAVDIKFNPTYSNNSSMVNSLERVVMYPYTVTVKKDVSGTVKPVEVKDTISASMNKNLFRIGALNNNISAVKIKTRLDTANGMLETCSVKWKIATDLVEIDTAIPINTTITPEEVKDLAAMYQVNQLTKLMSMYKTALANYKDDTILRKLNESYQTLDARAKNYTTYDFKPRNGYALDHIEWRSKTFMDHLDSHITKLLQVINDPNMTVSIFGDPDVIRKITPQEYSYAAPASIGPVELDYTQTVCNISSKRVYNFLSSDKLRGSDQLIVVLNPRNTDRIIYRIYDYQMYVSNEIRNSQNPALPALHAFERWLFKEYQGVQGRIKLLNVNTAAES